MGESVTFEWYDVERDPHGWDRYVTAFSQSIFHRNALLAAHQERGAFRRGVLIRSASQPIGALGGLLMPRPHGGRFMALSFPRACAAQEPALPRALGIWLLQQGVTLADLNSYEGGVEDYAADRIGRVAERLEFIYDLSRSDEERMRLVNNNHRRKIRRAESERMVLRRVESGEALLMTRLNRSWARRRGERYGLRRMWQMFSAYSRLTHRLRRDGCANLYGLYDAGNRILALAYMLERDGSSFYMIGASSEEGYARGASIRLFWELARHYPQVGIHRMNLGGVPAQARDAGHAEHGVYRFKLGFGIEPTVRHSLMIEA